jgi:hypothetical protein
VCKQLRAFKKNKDGVMISIVGFGRPKFKGAGAATPKEGKIDKSQKLPMAESQQVQVAIDLLKSLGYTITK